MNQNQADLTKCIARLETEVKKVNLNASLSEEERKAIIKEKHQTIMKPVLYVLKHLRSVTVAVAPQTPHEEWFQKTFKSHIESSIEQLENPAQPHSPTQTWQPIRLLHQSLQQRSQRKSAHLLDLRYISPALAKMNDTLISMPGVFRGGRGRNSAAAAAAAAAGSSDGAGVCISKCENVVSILPTKTKPKKLVFHGSDGRKNAYLFKGLEDLHLDERIMQFLSIVNTMFAKSGVSTTSTSASARMSSSSTPRYRARHYSVTPLGARSGLIQWVDGATPLFGLYKRWQQREALSAKDNHKKEQQQQQQQQPPNSSSTSEKSSSVPPPTVPRPTEIYYSKLTPALKELGVSASTESRKDWPLPVLKKVLEELVEETPADLLAREMWCSSLR